MAAALPTSSGPPEPGHLQADGDSLQAMESTVLATARSHIETEPVAGSAVVSGSPRTGVMELASAGVECGLWEHSTGVSTDVEVEEVFVVLSGRARIEIHGQEPLEVGPGDVVRLAAGARTTWHVYEHLRKFWVIPTD